MIKKSILPFLLLFLIAYCDSTTSDDVNQKDPITYINNDPTVTFIQPKDGIDGIIEEKDLGVIVDASDSDGHITSVVLYINDEYIRDDYPSPYEWGTASTLNDHKLLNLANGTYTLKATATDNEGASTSAEITVTVNVNEEKPPVEPGNLCDNYPEPDNGFKVGEVIRNYKMLDKHGNKMRMCELGEDGKYKIMFLAVAASW